MKVKKSELVVAREKLYSSQELLKEQLTAARSKVQDLLSSPHFTSKTKDAINAELTHYNLPLIQSYTDYVTAIYNEMDRLIQRFQEVVEETSEQAVIDTATFPDLEKSLKAPTEKILAEIDRQSLAAAYASISSIVSVSSPSSGEIRSALGAARSSLSTTQSKMESFNSESLNKGIGDIETSVSGALKKIGKTLDYKEPYLHPCALAIYQDRGFEKESFRNHQTVHDELVQTLKYYHPTMVFDTSQMTNEDLQSLGHAIAVASYGNKGQTPAALKRFLEGHSSSFEKEVKLYDDGKQYLKSKVSLKVSGSGKVKASFVNGQLSSIGIGPHSFTKEQQYQYSGGQERGGFTSGTNVNLGLQSLGLAASFGYGNTSVSVGMKSENPYKVAYAQYTTKTVAPNISTTSVVEIGKRHQDNIGNGMRATGEFVHSAFDWVAEHPVETVVTLGVMTGVAIIGVAVAPFVAAAIGSVASMQVMATGLGALLGVSIFSGNKKG